MKTTIHHPLPSQPQPSTQAPKQVTLFYREGSSDKVYQASLEAADNKHPDRFLVRFAYGRRGATLQAGTKTAVPVDYDTALCTFNQLVAAKLAKGYSPGKGGTPYQHTGHEGRATGIYPQLLEAVADDRALDHLLADPLFCAQEKHDGKRLLLRKQGDLVTGINRRGLVVPVPEPLVTEARYLPCDFLLDGEAVGEVLHVFDLLEHGGTCYREYPYNDRLSLLGRLLHARFHSLVPAHTAYSHREKVGLLDRLRREQREGLVLKNLTARYTPGRASGSASSYDQLKYKFVASASFLVTLVHPTKRSVSLGLYSGGEIVEAGNVTVPSNHDVPQAGTVVEVRYLYAFRQSGALYQPVYLGEREDIEPPECTTRQLKYRAEVSAALTIRV